MERTNKHQKKRIKWFSLVRITGLILVLSYHFFKTSFTGGFIGVDVFFVFSGFLITSLMLDEFQKSHRFDLIGFYRRRFYRIVPPLVMAVLVVLPLTYLVNPDFIANIGKQVAAAVGFVTNYYEIANGGSYESQFIPHLFVHTWSLAVEMHFYILWGLAIFILARILGPQARLWQFRSGVFLLSLGLAILSYLTMVLRSGTLTEFSPIYFATTTHSFPFFLGAGLGTLTGVATVTKHFRNVLAQHTWRFGLGLMVAPLTFLIILGFTLQFDHVGTYRWGILLASVLAGVMIYGARVLHEMTPTLKEPAVISFIADTSYSLYLYHWPLYVVFSHRCANGPAVMLTVALGLVLSALSYYVIEPIIAGRSANVFALHITWHQVARPLTAVSAALLVILAARTVQAPAMTGIEQTLWISSLHQDRDQLNEAEQAVMAVKNPEPAAAVATKATPTTKYNDYRDYTSTSTAAQHQIPSGVSIIGDSVTLGTRTYLGAHVAAANIDAAGDRTMDIAYNLLMEQQKANILREYVVLCIGTNALSDYAVQTQKVIANLAPGHKLIFMTPYNAQATATWNSTKAGVLERSLATKYDWVTIADWGNIAPKYPAIFAGTDGVHFAGRTEGDILYAKVINAALVQAAKSPAKK